MLQSALAFYDRRTEGYPLISLNEATESNRYGVNEMTRLDKFLRPYMGKEYPDRGGTEIITMGVEMLYNDPQKLAKGDPDYFDFLLQTLQKR